MRFLAPAHSGHQAIVDLLKRHGAKQYKEQQHAI